jgi:NADH-quinone oxidoreductase subunit L
VFHLYTHAFFKALMFLGSGAVIHALHGEQDIRKMGGLKKDIPITYWTFLIGAIAIAGVPPLAGFFSKDEILYRTFAGGHTILWAVGVATSLLTAIYMFRLVFLTFHGERAAAGHDHGHGGHGHAAHGGHGHDDHGHGGHLHDAPPAMAIPLVILALGSVLAGFVGVPHALGGSNRIESFLESSFHPAPAGEHGAAAAGESAHGAPAAAAHAPAADAHGEAAGGHAANESTELTLMGVSSVIALLGIGIAAWFFLANRAAADSVANSFAFVHRTLLNKYWIDELYDRTIVQPIKRTSDHVLWKVVDVWIIDGVVNGVGIFVRGSAAILRMVQTGSIRAYAASLVLGVVLVLGYYLMR